MSDANLIAAPRPYRDLRDLEQIQILLQAGRGAANGSYYVHSGDVSWWLFYTLPEDELWPYLYLWEAPGEAGLLGWSLVSPVFRAFDFYPRPDLRGSSQAAAMLDWTIGRARDVIGERGGTRVETVWVAEDDDLLIGWLDGRGFVRSAGGLAHFECSLAASLAEPALPQGFRFETMHGEDQAEARAAASYAAFGSRMLFERYCERYRRFMRSPVYRPQGDLMLLAEDGRCAGFCILWLDEANRVGLFEPVGVHPDFQGRGLGKALMLEGLRRLQADGMRRAIVSTESDNAAAVGLYRSSGFDLEKRLLTFACPL